MTQRDWLAVAVAYGLGHVAATSLVLVNRAAPYVLFDELTIPALDDGMIVAVFCVTGIVISGLWCTWAGLASHAPVAVVAFAFAVVPAVTGYMHVGLPHQFTSLGDVFSARTAMELLRWGGLWSFLACVMGGSIGRVARARRSAAPVGSALLPVLALAPVVGVSILAFDAVMPQTRDWLVESVGRISRNDAIALAVVSGLVINMAGNVARRRRPLSQVGYVWIAGAMLAVVYWSFRAPYLFYGKTMAIRGGVFASTALVCYLLAHAKPPVAATKTTRIALGLLFSLIVLWIGHQQLGASVASRVSLESLSIVVPTPLRLLTVPAWTAAIFAGLVSRTPWLQPFAPRLGAVVIGLVYYAYTIWVATFPEYRADFADVESPMQLVALVVGSLVLCVVCYATTEVGARIAAAAARRLKLV